MQLLAAMWAQNKFVCVGLDSELAKIPKHIKDRHLESSPVSRPIRDFNMEIIDTTKDIAAAYKPNLAFYLGLGEFGLKALENTCAYIHLTAPDVPIILDAKFGDIGNTNEHYARFTFEVMKADAVTVHNYMGSVGMKPFLDYKDKGIIVLCRTSNAGSGEFQEVPVPSRLQERYGDSFFVLVGNTVSKVWNENNNCMLVMGGTYAEDFKKVRAAAPQIPFLIPGIGAQGGDLENAVRNSMTEDGNGFIVNSSRGIIFASNGEDYATRAREETIKLNDQINEVRKKVLAERHQSSLLKYNK